MKRSETTEPKDTKPKRPTLRFRAWRDEQVAQVEAGTLDLKKAWYIRGYPEEVLNPLDDLLDIFEAEVTIAVSTGKELEIFGVFAAVKRFILGTNKLTLDIDSTEREHLLTYIDDFVKYKGFNLKESGKDLRFDSDDNFDYITEPWRKW
ncbi:hypothetical protein Q8F55_003048 [Vanrija albida]|uniref:Uncharacterized protein n=1 Tax=Vanrija albida TaxID=181172 RepID=A0ABR3QCF8_9TREE